MKKFYMILTLCILPLIFIGATTIDDNLTITMDDIQSR